MTTDDDFPIDGLPGLDPSPDEEAWETYLTFALEHLGADGSTGLTNSALADLEQALGTQLPFESGLLLVMGVPDDDRWRRWGDDPAAEFATWNAGLLDGILFDVEENDVWMDSWGHRPDSEADRAALVGAALATAPPLLPLYGHRAVPIGQALGEEKAESNPVLSISGTDLITYGSDLAAWLHAEFDVPLPMWPETPYRRFEFWSDFIE